ncbi:MAG: ATP-dependent Clp protease ATP-binding subunit [Candidatus Parcubacteria bacterium]|nr:ATP-dependent Clp protease ATP-binding subunit [Candidatus Parcubacteria bacterium]
MDQVEDTLDKIFKEVINAKNVILVIDDFHNFVGGEIGPGKIDITGILATYLKFAEFKIIAIASYTGLHKQIEENPTVLNLFSKVEVKEPSPQETIRILQRLAPRLEAKYNRFITYPAIGQVVELTGRYIADVPFPKKAINVLEEAMIKTDNVRGKWVLPEDIDRIVARKTEIPVGKIETKEKEILLNLEDLIHQRIINQEEAVREVSTSLRRARAKLKERKGPMGGFLFLGPTGVGKTETSKALAEIYFGSEEKMIRLDMSEFQSQEDIPRLMGSSGEEGLLTTPVREDPFSLVLLDEIEKAHPNILNLFLQVLDDGHITDGLGRKVDFKNTIIIATSNAGYEVILDALRNNLDFSVVKEKLLNRLFDEKTFRPEFINRFDAVVLFKPLTKENLLDIAQLMLKSIQQGLIEKNIEFIITEELKEKIVELGYDITFGARNLKRVIQDNVENVLAEALLKDEVKKGDRIQIDSKKFKIKILD